MLICKVLASKGCFEKAKPMQGSQCEQSSETLCSTQAFPIPKAGSQMREYLHSEYQKRYL